MTAFFDTRASQIGPRGTQLILDHVERKWKLEQCRLCEGAEFEILAQVTLRYFDDTTVIASPNGAYRPTAAITCTTCGHVLLLDLFVAGVFQRERDEPEPPPAGPYR